MPKSKGPKKPRRKRFNLVHKIYTHAGGPKGRSGYAGVKGHRKRANSTKTKRKHGRR